jgi:hypothetical protein
MSQRLEISGPDVVFEEFDGEIVVLNLLTGRYFGFNPSAGVVWEALMAGISPENIQARTPDAVDITSFVAGLIDNGLVVPSLTGASVLAEPMAAQLASLAGAPELEAYDDLADLIIADPIHDTDPEQGWPVPAPQS